MSAVPRLIADRRAAAEANRKARLKNLQGHATAAAEDEPPPWDAEELALYRWIKAQRPDYVVFENGDCLDVKNTGGDMDRAAANARANITMPPRRREASHE